MKKIRVLIARAGRLSSGMLPVLVLALVSAINGCAAPVEREDLAREYFNLGNAYFELEDYDRSYQYYRRALDLDPRIPAAGYNLARLHLERREYRAALEVLDQLLEDDPENTLLRETRAYTRHRLGATDEARREYRALLEYTVAHRRVAYNLGLLEMDAEQFDTAADVLSDHLVYAEDDREYRWLLAEALFFAERRPEALAELEYYRTLVENHPSELGELARRYADWGYYLAALEIIEDLPQATVREPLVAWAHSRSLLLGSEEFEAGLEALEGALRGGFDDAPAIEELITQLPEDEQRIIRDLLGDDLLEDELLEEDLLED